jgi:hypothetical protein
LALFMRKDLSPMDKIKHQAETVKELGKLQAD